MQQKEGPQTNHTIYKTCSDKIIPAKKRKKLLSCIGTKEDVWNHTYPPCFRNNITGPPTEIKPLSSILFVSFVSLKQHNKDKLIIEASKLQGLVSQCIKQLNVEGEEIIVSLM